MSIPEEWTDDMSVDIKFGKTNRELAASLLFALDQRQSYEEMMSICSQDFGLTEDDGDLAIDRVQGGVVRAITCNSVNCPEKSKDPLAWYSFQSVWKTLPRKNWWSLKKDNQGKWLKWYNERTDNDS